MVQYKLTYFSVRGLGEMSRLILHYANVPFEDVRIAQDDWPNYKDSKKKDNSKVAKYFFRDTIWSLTSS